MAQPPRTGPRYKRSAHHAAAHLHEALRLQAPDGFAHRGPAHAKEAGKLPLVGQPLADGERSRGHGILNLLGDPVRSPAAVRRLNPFGPFLWHDTPPGTSSIQQRD